MRIVRIDGDVGQYAAGSVLVIDTEIDPYPGCLVEVGGKGRDAVLVMEWRSGAEIAGVVVGQVTD